MPKRLWLGCLSLALCVTSYPIRSPLFSGIKNFHHPLICFLAISEKSTSFVLPFTPWKINMEPKNGGLEDDVPLQLGDS